MDAALKELIELTTTGVKFLKEEIPEVIHELLVWKMTVSILQTCIGVFLAAGIVYILCKYAGRGESVSEYYYKETLTHTAMGNVGERIVLVVIAVLLSAIICAALVNFTWVQIWLAPRIYLIEYAASLSK